MFQICRTNAIKRQHYWNLNGYQFSFMGIDSKDLDSAGLYVNVLSHSTTLCHLDDIYDAEDSESDSREDNTISDNSGEERENDWRTEVSMSKA